MIKIKSVLTALGNQKINEKLKKFKKLNILGNDIKTQEEILKFLEMNEVVDFLILNENLKGKYELKDLLIKIKKLNNQTKVILITNKKDKNIKVYKKINYKFLNEKNISNMIKEKEIFLNSNIKMDNYINENEKKGKIITLLGSNSVGKSIFSLIFSKNLEKKKILIIDFDVFNKSLHRLLRIKNYSGTIHKNIKNNNFKQILNNFEKSIIKSEFNIDLVSAINLIFDYNNQKNPNELKNIIKNFQKNYDFIIIDSSTECFFEYTKEITKISDKLIFISGINDLDIKKSEKILKIYNEEWNIPTDKINIILNDNTKNLKKILKFNDIFKNYNIIGKIKLSDYYDFLINKNKNKKSEIENEIKKIKNIINK